MRIEAGLRDRLVAEARGEGRSSANMLERILGARYASVQADVFVGPPVVSVQSPVQDVPVETNPGPRSWSLPSEKGAAAELAVRDGKCGADVARGTRCKLCGKVH